MAKVKTAKPSGTTRTPFRGSKETNMAKVKTGGGFGAAFAAGGAAANKATAARNDPRAQAGAGVNRAEAKGGVTNRDKTRNAQARGAVAASASGGDQR